MELRTTGGGAPLPEVDEISLKTYHAIPEQFDSLTNRMDGDTLGNSMVMTPSPGESKR